MQTKSLSQMFIHLKSWLALAALTVCFVSMSALAAAAVPSSVTWDGPCVYLDFTIVNQMFEVAGGANAYCADPSGWSFDFTANQSGQWYDYTEDGIRYIGGKTLGGTFTLYFDDKIVYTSTPLGGDYWAVIPGGAHDEAEQGFGLTINRDDTLSMLKAGGWGQADLYFVSPEPSSLVLLGSGIVGLAGMLRRKLSR